MPRNGEALDPETIVATAIGIADAEGLEALTMRRIASEFGVTPMALYHHVPGKDRLLDLVADQSMAVLPELDPELPWQDNLVSFFLAFHRLYLDHPALAQVMAHRPLEGPIAAAHGERILRLLVDAGVPDDQAAAALVSLAGYTIGSSLYRLSRGPVDSGGRQRFAEVTEEAAPTVFRLRDHIARTAEADDHFVDGLRRLIASYGSR